jgi:hypothetical protein
MRFSRALLLACAIVAAGCQFGPRQPEMLNATIAPAVLQPGDTAIMSVQVRDRYGIVQRVEASVVGEDEIVFKLRDDGEPPDARARDGIWTLDVTVPFTAPPGPFEIEVRGYNATGELILVRSNKGDTLPLADSFTVEVRYPDQR